MRHFFDTLPRQFVLALCTIVLQTLPIWSQTYSWKLVAPFPYYRAEHVIKGNNVFLAYGRIIDSLDQSSGNKIEIGTTPFFLVSSDAKTWKQISPKVVYPKDKAAGTAGREEMIIPLKIFFVNSSFISLAQNSRNEKKIYLSENGTDWHPAGIDASSLNFIHDRLIVEHDLAFSVSTDGKNWETYGTVFPGQPERHKSIAKENRTVSIVAENPSLVSFNGDSVLGYYADSSYVLTDNDRTIAVSRDGVHWRVVERSKYKKGSLIEDVIGYMFGNHHFVYVTSSEDKEGFIFSSTDGKEWEKNSIDTLGLIEEYGEFFSLAGFKRFFFYDSLFFITRIANYSNYSSGGLSTVSVQYISADGKGWEKNRESQGGNPETNLPSAKWPGEWKVSKLDSLDRHFKLNSAGTLEPVVIRSFYEILFDKNQFVLPVEHNKTYLQSLDGYSWQCKKWDIDSTIFLMADPYYRGTQTFVYMRKTKKDSPTDETEEGIRWSVYLTISKDRKDWDTISIDTLLANSNDYSDLKKYPDGLIITIRDEGNWYSANGRKWKPLDIRKSRTDSCRVYAQFSATGDTRKIYMFPDGTAKLSNGSGTEWFPVTNTTKEAKAVCFGNGRFVAAGKNGKIWVLEEKDK